MGVADHAGGAGVPGDAPGLPPLADLARAERGAEHHRLGRQHPHRGVVDVHVVGAEVAQLGPAVVDLQAAGGQGRLAHPGAALDVHVVDRAVVHPDHLVERHPHGVVDEQRVVAAAEAEAPRVAVAGGDYVVVGEEHVARAAGQVGAAVAVAVAVGLGRDHADDRVDQREPGHLGVGQLIVVDEVDRGARALRGRQDGVVDDHAVEHQVGAFGIDHDAAELAAAHADAVAGRPHRAGQVAQVQEVDHHRGAERDVAVVAVADVEHADATGRVGHGDRGAGGGAGVEQVAPGLRAGAGDGDLPRRRRQGRGLVRADRAAAVAGQGVEVERGVQRVQARAGRRVGPGVGARPGVAASAAIVATGHDQQ